MKHKNWMFVLFPLISIIIAMITFLGLASEDNNVGTNISVIVDDDNSDRWKICRQGLESGANERGIDINFIVMDAGMSESERIKLLTREIENRAEGLILDIEVSEGVLAYLDEISSGIPVVFLESSVDSLSLYSSVGVNPVQIGEAMGEGLINIMQEKQCKVGIVMGKGEKNSYQQRADSLIEYLSNFSNIDIAWEIDGSIFSLYTSLIYHMNEDPVDYLLTLENYATELAVDYKEREEAEIGIIGIGNTEKNLYHVDKGTIQTLFVPDEYKIGYLAVYALTLNMQEMTAERGNGSYPQVHNYVDYFTVTKENLFEEDMQYFLFPK